MTERVQDVGALGGGLREALSVGWMRWVASRVNAGAAPRIRAIVFAIGLVAASLAQTASGR